MNNLAIGMLQKLGINTPDNWQIDLVSSFLKPALLSTDDINTNLTNREQEILGLLASGLSQKQIMYEINIERTTMSFHTKNILGKLGCSTVNQAIYNGVKMGCIA